MWLKIGKYHIKLDHGWLNVNIEVPHKETESLIETHRQTLEKNPNDILTRFILGNVLRIDGKVHQARFEYEKVVEAKDPQLSPQATRILTEIEGKPDNLVPTRTQKYLFHVHIFPSPVGIWRRLKLGIKRRLTRHKFITSSVTQENRITPDKEKQNQYYLTHQETLLGVLQADRLDWPWVFCHFQPTIDFEQVKTRFDEEVSFSARNGSKGWEAWYDDNIKILDLKLIDASSAKDIGYSILHIHDNKAWFRPLWGRK